MSGQLFEDAELFNGDPLCPDFDQVCPETVLADLTQPEREQRVTALIAQAHHIIDKAWELADGRMRAAWCVLYSGGNDSTVLAHMVRHRVDYAVHANTTIGVEATREFVRETCRNWGLDLLERTAPTPYRDLVIERGFPGPAMHYKMYQRLKERVLEQVRNELVHDSRRQRVLFIAGRRRSESRRRNNIPFYETDGSIIWSSPLGMWTKTDLVTYRGVMSNDDAREAFLAKLGTRGESFGYDTRRPAEGPVPFNPVTDHLGMSGECLCGAFAQPGELERIRCWYPDVAAEIDALAAEVKAAGHREPFCRWGHGEGKPSNIGRMCSSCDINQLELFQESA